MKTYRLLVELDEYGNEMESFALYSIGDDSIVDWFGTAAEATSWVKENGGTFAVSFESTFDDEE
jgi:hypothetical protein